MTPCWPFVVVLVAIMERSWALERGVADHLSLLQAELERSKGSSAKAPLLPQVDANPLLPQESICEQLAGSAAPGQDKASTCTAALAATGRAAAAAHAGAKDTLQVQTTVAAGGLVPAAGQEVARRNRSTGGAALGYTLDALIVALVLDGLMRWRRKRRDSEPVLDSWGSLMQAALAGDAARCEALINGGTSIEGSDLWGCMVLHAASKGGSLAIVSKLLEHGASVDKCDSWDDTPLHLAARAGHADICELLLAHGAPINAMNAQDWTPLVVAADAGHERVCNLLAARGGGVADLKKAAFPAQLTSLFGENAFEQQDGLGLQEAAEEDFSPLEDDSSDEGF